VNSTKFAEGDWSSRLSSGKPGKNIKQESIPINQPKNPVNPVKDIF
jgi:hypothetical protein